MQFGIRGSQKRSPFRRATVMASWRVARASEIRPGSPDKPQPEEADQEHERVT